MIEPTANLLFALESCKRCGVALDSKQRNFHRHGLIAILKVFGFENRRHAAFANHIGEQKAVVEYVPQTNPRDLLRLAEIAAFEPRPDVRQLLRRDGTTGLWLIAKAHGAIFCSVTAYRNVRHKASLE